MEKEEQEGRRGSGKFESRGEIAQGVHVFLSVGPADQNYSVSNTIDFFQQLIFQSGCSVSVSLRTLSRRNMIVS